MNYILINDANNIYSFFFRKRNICFGIYKRYNGYDQEKYLEIVVPKEFITKTNKKNFFKKYLLKET
jgi:hypothetical protein